jgi:hypothetical protein
MTAVLSVLVFVLCLALWKSGDKRRLAELERDEWMEKAKRYYESADRGSLGEQTSQALQARCFTDAQLQMMAQRQRDLMNSCGHGLALFECPFCSHYRGSSGQAF